MNPNGRRQELKIDADCYVYVDGVKIARLVDDCDGQRCLEFLDKDWRRGSRRGTTKIRVAVKQLLALLDG